MKSNGRSRSTSLHVALDFQSTTRALPTWTRLALWTWLRSWRHRPGRVFWELDPGTGEWRRL